MLTCEGEAHVSACLLNASRLAGEYHWLNAVPSAAVGSELDDVSRLSWLIVRLFQSCTIADDDSMIGVRDVPGKD